MGVEAMPRSVILALLAIAGVETNPGPQMYAYGVNEANQAVILHEHNKWRQRVANGQEGRGTRGAQPQAANMRRLYWDNEIAAKAQNWANNCRFAHDTTEQRRIPRMSCGQNLYMSYSSSSADQSQDWPAAIKSLYDEVAMFDSALVTNFRFAMNTGHYTQVAWAETHLVGAGFAMFYDPSQPQWPYSKMYVLNYGPAGNMMSAPMYRIGAPASQCPPGTKPDEEYAGLVS